MSDLRKSKQDTSRISLLLRIAKFHIFKPGETRSDFDSGWALINQTEQLNKILHSAVSEGNILILKAYYLRESGQRDLAQGLSDIKKIQIITEKEYIRSILKKAGGRIRGEGGAAQLLSIPPTTLESKMARLGIKKEAD